MSHTVAFLAADGVQTLDLTGPREIFAGASEGLRRLSRPGGYTLLVLSPDGGPVRTSSGLGIVADGPWSRAAQAQTVLIPGGDGIEVLLKDGHAAAQVAEVTRGAQRVGSICTGAFLLAAAGLLDGRQATTHWAYCRQLARHYPAVTVLEDPIFVRDGRLITSAGVTAGMDLALALVEDDHGAALAVEVARWFVMFLQRPGGQSQFSAQLSLQRTRLQPITTVQAHIVDHPGGDLSVPVLARRVGMSPRHFSRVFSREVGCSPGAFVQRVRLEAARRRLEQSDDGLDRVARLTGFGTAEALRRAFQRALGIPPSRYRRRFRRAQP